MQNSTLNQPHHCTEVATRRCYMDEQASPGMGLNPRAQSLMRRKDLLLSQLLCHRGPSTDSWSLQHHQQIWTLGTVSATQANRSKFFRVSFGLLMCNTLLVILLLPEFNKHHMKPAQKLNNGKPWLIIALGLLLSFSLKIPVLFVTP